MTIDKCTGKSVIVAMYADTGYYLGTIHQTESFLNTFVGRQDWEKKEREKRRKSRLHRHCQIQQIRFKVQGYFKGSKERVSVHCPEVSVVTAVQLHSHSMLKNDKHRLVDLGALRQTLSINKSKKVKICIPVIQWQKLQKLQRIHNSFIFQCDVNDKMTL